MARTLAVVVSYNPQASILENIQTTLSQVDHLVVVDNQSTQNSQALLAQLPQDRVTLILNDFNLGVGTGFNQGLKWGIRNGFDLYLLLDQDSRPQEQMVKTLQEVLTSFESRGEMVLVGPHHEDFDRPLPRISSEPVVDYPLLITSGSLLSRKLVEKVGFYDDRLFIDHVDHDYCLRVVKRGGRCLKVNPAVLRHKFGEAEIRSVLGKKFFLQDYSPFRRYHMMRNRIVLYKRYGMFKGEWFWLDFKSACKDLVKLVLFERGKGAKLAAVFRGLKDGVFWKD